MMIFSILPSWIQSFGIVEEGSLLHNISLKRTVRGNSVLMISWGITGCWQWLPDSIFSGDSFGAIAAATEGMVTVKELEKSFHTAGFVVE